MSISLNHSILLLICSQGFSGAHNYSLKSAKRSSLLQMHVVALFISIRHFSPFLSHTITLNTCLIISMLFCLLACVSVYVCEVVGLWIIQTQLASDLTLAQCVGLGRSGLQLRLPAPHRLRQHTLNVMLWNCMQKSGVSFFNKPTSTRFPLCFFSYSLLRPAFTCRFPLWKCTQGQPERVGLGPLNSLNTKDMFED